MTDTTAEDTDLLVTFCAAFSPCFATMTDTAAEDTYFLVTFFAAVFAIVVYHRWIAVHAAAWYRQNLGRCLRLSRDTSDTRSLGYPCDIQRDWVDLSGVQVPDTGTLGYGESEHVDARNTFG
jgi:hypothetical protein